MADSDRLRRIEAMLAELLRRFTPPEAIPAMAERLSDYQGGVRDVETFKRWLAGEAMTSTEGDGDGG